MACAAPRRSWEVNEASAVTESRVLRRSAVVNFYEVIAPQQVTVLTEPAI